MRCRGLHFLLTGSVLMLAWMAASAQTDSLRASAVTAARPEGLAIPTAEGVSLDMEQVKTLPMLLGTADPLTFAHYLPSMSIQTELESGIHIQGNNHSHNMVSSGDVPIYGAAHLLGLFSVFNPTHFTRLDYSTVALESNRLGGRLDMALPDSLHRRVGGEFSLGLMAIQGTLQLPLGKRVAVTVSARRSYLNLLYGSFLKIDGTPMRYGFTDANLTLQWQPGSRDRLWLDAYFGNDAVFVKSASLDVTESSGWRNAMGALHWEHRFDGGSLLHQRLYTTGFGLDLAVSWTGLRGSLPSYLHTVGYAARWTQGGWTASLESAFHQAQPQSPVIEGEFNESFQPQPVQRGWENTLLGRYNASWGRFSLAVGLKGSLYLSPERHWYARLDPDLKAGVDFYRGGRLEALIGLRHQYLFQTGFSDIGLPTEYWFLASDAHRPQGSLDASLSYTLRFGRADAWMLQVQAYHQWLRGQVEYKGNLLELVNVAYNPDDVILTGDGRAFGVNVSLHKTAGALTGWVAYSWGRSLRRFQDPDYPGEYPAGFERIHELDAVVSWKLGRWTLGATFVVATGTPFTAPEHLYLMGGQLVAQYGPHNGRRLAPYLRLDVSAGFRLCRKEHWENGLQVSLYNATGYKNELCYQLRTDAELGFAYAPQDFYIRFMPSISYYHKFR